MKTPSTINAPTDESCLRPSTPLTPPASAPIITETEPDHSPPVSEKQEPHRCFSSETQRDAQRMCNRICRGTERKNQSDHYYRYQDDSHTEWKILQKSPYGGGSVIFPSEL